jgi:hypothetical protein
MMSSPTCSYGFRVLGKTTNRRRLVDAGAAFVGYVACDSRAEVRREAYLSAFVFPDDFRRHLQETGSSKGYAGLCSAPWVWFDLDRAGDLDAALRDGRRLAAGILQRYRSLNDDDLLLFFSGAKGVHIGLPVTWGPTPSVLFHRVARGLAEGLAAEIGVNVDTAVYDKVRLFRAPNSRHPKTGLYKRRLLFDELLYLSSGRVRQMAAAPEPFDLPNVTAVNDRAAADWQAALKVVEQEAEAQAQRGAALVDGTARLNRATLKFICDGAEQGKRAQQLFSAAANLAEFACPPALAHALLTEAALDSGLAPAEVRRQIDCGLAHVGKEAPDA